MLTEFAFWLKQVFGDLAQFFIDMFLSILDWIWAGFMSVLDGLPIASTAEQAAHLFDAIPSVVWYFMNMLSIQYGLPIVLGAYLIRFFIRRLPVIG